MILVGLLKVSASLPQLVLQDGAFVQRLFFFDRFRMQLAAFADLKLHEILHRCVSLDFGVRVVLLVVFLISIAVVENADHVSHGELVVSSVLCLLSWCQRHCKIMARVWFLVPACVQANHGLAVATSEFKHQVIELFGNEHVRVVDDVTQQVLNDGLS